MASTTTTDAAEVRRHLMRLASLMDTPDGGGGGVLPCTTDPDFAPRRMVALITLVLLAAVHAQRLLVTVANQRASRERVARELLIAGLGVLGLVFFWMDVRHCRLYEGLLKLLLFVGVANVLIPCIWRVPPMDPAEGHEDPDEVPSFLSSD